MTRYHACVWIDHREAKIFAIDSESAEETVLRDLHAPAHIHRKADQVGLGKEPPDQAFFAGVAELLKPYKAVLITGPGTARTEFAGYLTEKQPILAKRVWGIEPLDHPTEGQMVALARKYFRAADRMHGGDSAVRG